MTEKAGKEGGREGRDVPSSKTLLTALKNSGCPLFCRIALNAWEE